MKRVIDYLAYLIERKRGIRRGIVLTAFPAWLILSIWGIVDYIKHHVFSTGFASFYATFTSVIAIVVGFYFHTRGKVDKGGE